MKKKWIIVSCMMASLFLGLMAFLYALKNENPFWQEEQKTQKETEEPFVPEEEETRESGMEEEESQEKEPLSYPAPEYCFTEEEVTVEIPGIKGKYTLAWVSDLHIISDTEPSGDITQEAAELLLQRYETFSVTKEGIHSDDLWSEIVKYLNYGYVKEEGGERVPFDGIILGGDLMDYYSEANMDHFMQGYIQLNPDVPIMYIWTSDHDYYWGYSGNIYTEADIHSKLHKQIDGKITEERIIDFGEFLVVGINESTKDISAEQYEFIEKVCDSGKPVIIATHVPYAPNIEAARKDLEAKSMEARGKIYYWDEVEHGEGVTVQYKPNNITTRLLMAAYEKETCIQEVLAGHLHVKWDGRVTDTLKQHIFSPAYSGTIGIIHVVGKRAEE